jgi:hypothetical protein
MLRRARLRPSASLALCAALLCAAPPARAFEPLPEPPEEPKIDWSLRGPQVFDAVVLRPLGAGAALAGAGFFVIAAPLAWYAEGIDAVYEFFVQEPVDFTFVRPLGDF